MSASSCPQTKLRYRALTNVGVMYIVDATDATTERNL